jgi:hypothetical protein
MSAPTTPPRRRVALVLVAVAVALAGCSVGYQPAGPTADGRAATPTAGGTATADGTPTGNETATAERTETPSDYGVTVEGELPADVDADQVYERVQRLLGVAANSDVTVRVREPQAGEGTFQLPDRLFVAYMGVEAPQGGGGAAGVTTAEDEVILYAGNWSAYRTELVLAHEFVHTLQFQQDVRRGLYDPGSASNQNQIVGAVIEGAATYVHREYVREYWNRSPSYVTRFNDSSAFGKWAYARYDVGGRYMAERFDNPTELPAVYEAPPETTEQLLHGYDPGEEPARELSVDVDSESYRVGRERTTGELIVNVVLSAELDDERAWTGADGWGADRLLRLRGDGEEGYAWVLRWDSAAEAEEFRDALETFLDARGERTDGRWHGPDHVYDVEMTGDETVALFVGTEGFVETASLSGGDANVTVEL